MVSAFSRSQGSHAVSASPAQAPSTTLPARPGQIVMNLVVTLLTPFFLDAAGGNPGLARAAAFETVNQQAARDGLDLIFIAQAAAFGLAALDALSQSTQDGLPAEQTLRLRT